MPPESLISDNARHALEEFLKHGEFGRTEIGMKNEVSLLFFDIIFFSFMLYPTHCGTGNRMNHGTPVLRHSVDPVFCLFFIIVIITSCSNECLNININLYVVCSIAWSWHCRCSCHRQKWACCCSYKYRRHEW